MAKMQRLKSKMLQLDKDLQKAQIVVDYNMKEITKMLAGIKSMRSQLGVAYDRMNKGERGAAEVRYNDLAKRHQQIVAVASVLYKLSAKYPKIYY